MELFSIMRSEISEFGAQAIRDVVRCRGRCLDAGFAPDHSLIITLEWIRNLYISRVGLPGYLSQMLGDVAQISMRFCTLCGVEGQSLDGRALMESDQRRRLQYFIRDRFGIGDLPYRVEVALGVDQMREVYL